MALGESDQAGDRVRKRSTTVLRVAGLCFVLISAAVVVSSRVENVALDKASSRRGSKSMLGGGATAAPVGLMQMTVLKARTHLRSMACTMKYR